MQRANRLAFSEKSFYTKYSGHAILLQGKGGQNRSIQDAMHIGKTFAETNPDGNGARKVGKEGEGTILAPPSDLSS